MANGLVIGGKEIKPGQQETVNFKVPDLYTHTNITMPVNVIRGKKSGPVLFICAAVHGDEINGVEIIRRVLQQPAIKRLRGTLVAIPVVNIYGFLNKTRYLPDRRDLNRSFPGSETGSLAARIAHIFLNEIVAKCDYGIDLHTAAVHRDNLPQVRALLDDPETERIAKSFSVPVILDTRIVEGSLREAVEKMNIPVVVYEAGEALRFDEVAIRAGVDGILSVLRELSMLPASRSRKKKKEPEVAKSSVWIRAQQSGLIRSVAALGQRVKRGEVLGIISDPSGDEDREVRTNVGGIIIGRSNIPLVNEGEALFHIARFDSVPDVAENIEEFIQEYDPETDDKPADEPAIV